MAYTTIDDPSVYFQIELYTGDGSGAAHTFDGATDLAPGLLWIKSRSASNSSHVVDSVRGYNKALASDSDSAEYTSKIASLDSDGFTTSDGAYGSVSTDGRTYVAWCWKESATSGFDIVSYTGDGVIGTTVAHSLSAKPEFIVVKARAGTNGQNDWYTWHVGLAANKGLKMSTTAAEFTDPGEGLINSTQNTSTFGFYSSDSSGVINVNEDSTTFIAYLFAPKQGFSKFGSYATNNNADGPFIYTGFKPAWVMLKVVDGNTGGWDIYDNKRGINPNEEVLQANADGAEASNDAIDLVSNGFKIRNTSGNQNGSGDTVIYMAFAEAPFVNSGGVPANAE